MPGGTMRRQRSMKSNVPGRRRLTGAALGLLCICLGFSRPASAQTSTYTVNAGTYVQDTLPVSQSGGTATEGGEGSAGAALRAEAHAYAAATNSLTSAFKGFGATANAQYRDIVFTGPTPTVAGT